MAAGGGQLGADLRAPGGEGPHHRRVDPGQLVGAAARWPSTRPPGPRTAGGGGRRRRGRRRPWRGHAGRGRRAPSTARRCRGRGWPPPRGCAGGGRGPGSARGRSRRPPGRRPAGAGARGPTPGGPSPPGGSRSPSPPPPARSWAARTSADTSGGERAKRTLTDLGAVKVRSKPATPPRLATRGRPSPGRRPASTASRSLRSTGPDSPRPADPAPVQSPGTILSAPAGNPGGAELGRQVVEVVPAGAVGQAGDAQHVGAGRPAAREPPCAEHARAGVRFESWRSWRVSGKTTIIAGVPGQQGRASTPISDAVGTRAGSTRGRCRRKAPRSSCASSACATPTGPRSPPVPRERRSFSLSFMPFDASAGGVASEHPASRGGTRPPQLGRVEHPGPRPEL